MPSLEAYSQQISDMGLDRLEISASNPQEARQAIQTIDHLQQDLRQMRHSINSDMVGIRAMYRERMAQRPTSLDRARLLGRMSAEQFVREERLRLRQERDQRLAGYHSLSLTIRDMIVQMDTARRRLEAYIGHSAVDVVG